MTYGSKNIKVKTLFVHEHDNFYKFSSYNVIKKHNTKSFVIIIKIYVTIPNDMYNETH